MVLQMTDVREYRTSDMAMVTYLRVAGHAVQRVAWESRVCHWYFYATKQLLQEVERFMEGNARIDPKEYSRAYAQTKREFYDTDDSSDRSDEDHNRLR